VAIMSSWADTGRFLRAFARDPLHTAAIAPSSAALAAAMTLPVPTTGSPVVVELGPGTGSFTAAIQDRLGGRGRHLAVELHPGWAELLSQRYPGVEVVVDDVRSLADILDARGIARVNAVVSGLPWVAYAPRPGGRPLHAVISEALAPTGAFTQFAYCWTRWAPPARRQLAELRAHFAEVETSRTVWRNLPPAVVHTARRPRHHSAAGEPTPG
jgi:phosphatidylethanolamine/phosphatidyl-N-methylethanolamine N-methyltransferase